MFNWDKLTQDLKISKLIDRSLVPSSDKIHCKNCNEHISDHGFKNNNYMCPNKIIDIIKNKLLH